MDWGLLFTVLLLIEPNESLFFSNNNQSFFADKCIAFLNDAHLFYSAELEDRNSLYSHISDDFVWHWESDTIIGKQKFIELNEKFFGHYSFAETQFLIDALGDKYCGGISYGFVNKAVDDDHNCKSWLFLWEVFIFNDDNSITKRYSFPIDKRIYTLNNNMLNDKHCRWGKDKWDYDKDEQLLLTIDTKMKSFFNHSQLFYSGALENKQLFYNEISEQFDWYYGSQYKSGKDLFITENEMYYNKYDEINIMWELDAFGEYYTGGYTHTYVRVNQCRATFINLIVAYFDWDIQKIIHFVNLPVTNQQIITQFQNCIKDNQLESDKKDEL